MRRILVTTLVVAVLACVPALAERVHLVVGGTPITLNGNDVIYVDHGWLHPQDENGVWGYILAGYHSFRAYALDRLSYQLFIDGVEVAPTAFQVIRREYQDLPAWRAGWLFNFPPGSIAVGTHEFMGVYRSFEDGVWSEATRVREVTIEYWK